MSNRAEGVGVIHKYCDQTAKGQDVQMPEVASRAGVPPPGLICLQWACRLAWGPKGWRKGVQGCGHPAPGRHRADTGQTLDRHRADTGPQHRESEPPSPPCLHLYCFNSNMTFMLETLDATNKLFYFPS